MTKMTKMSNQISFYLNLTKLQKLESGLYGLNYCFYKSYNKRVIQTKGYTSKCNLMQGLCFEPPYAAKYTKNNI